VFVLVIDKTRRPKENFKAGVEKEYEVTWRFLLFRYHGLGVLCLLPPCLVVLLEDPSLRALDDELLFSQQLFPSSFVSSKK